MGIIALELGGATLATICNSPQVSNQQKLAYAVDVVNNVAFLHRCRVVWGDVKPENLVLFYDVVSGVTTMKMIDFGSSAVLARALNEKGELVAVNGRVVAESGIVTAEFTSSDKISVGLVSPERAFAMLYGKIAIVTDCSQDMWSVGVLLHNIICDKEEPLFKTDEVDKRLLVLGNPRGSQENKDERLAAEAKLEHIVKKKLGSNNDVARRVIQDLLKADPEERPTASELSERQSMKGGMSLSASTVMSKMDDIGEKQEELMKCMEHGFDAMAANLQATFQLIVNMQRGDVPAIVVAAPGMRNEPAGKYYAMKTIGKKLLKKIGWRQQFMIYIVDEGPFLLPGEIEADDEPIHAGFEVNLPGPLLVKLAPLLYVFSKLMLVAHHAGGGLPIPKELPFLSDVQKDDDAMRVRLKGINEGFEKVLSASGQIGTVNDVVDDMAAKLVGDGKGAEGSGQRSVAPATTHLFDESYDAIKTVLETLCPGNASANEMGWEQFKNCGIMEQVYNKLTGSIHWVASKSVKKLVASGKFTADQRSLEGEEVKA